MLNCNLHFASSEKCIRTSSPVTEKAMLSANFCAFSCIYKRFFLYYNLQYVNMVLEFLFMTSDFNRIITLLRKEKGVTQKQAAEALGVSQALLSHYEKGIRECGLEFVVRVADYYGVSCDYLLGRSADRSGLTLSVEDIPTPDSAKDGVFHGSVLPTFNKKLIANSLNILYDKLNACPDKGLVSEISAYLMLSVYKMFRLLYHAGPKNASNMFGVRKSMYSGYADAAMRIAETNVKAILAGEDVGTGAPLKDTSAFAMTTESLSRDYPLYATSLLNLVKNSEGRIDNK